MLSSFTVRTLKAGLIDSNEGIYKPKLIARSVRPSIEICRDSGGSRATQMRHFVRNIPCMPGSIAAKRTTDEQRWNGFGVSGVQRTAVAELLRVPIFAYWR